MDYSSHVIDVRKTREFSEWHAGLKDVTAGLHINRRIARLEAGNFGNAKTVGGTVSELRINYGPGYRVYFTRRGGVLVILLCGGDKATQARDIKRAKALAAELE